MNLQQLNMTLPEKFSLKWNDFQQNISTAFSNLRVDTNLSDVTLISEDGQTMEAHNVILSASSPFFMNVFKLNKHSHPMIYLKGLKAKQLSAMLDFVSCGVPDVFQDALEEFLDMAQELQLKGLAGGSEEFDDLK